MFTCYLTKMGIPENQRSGFFLHQPPVKKLFFNENTCYRTNGNFYVNLLATHDV